MYLSVTLLSNETFAGIWCERTLCWHKLDVFSGQFKTGCRPWSEFWQRRIPTGSFLQEVWYMLKISQRHLWGHLVFRQRWVRCPEVFPPFSLTFRCQTGFDSITSVTPARLFPRSYSLLFRHRCETCSPEIPSAQTPQGPSGANNAQYQTSGRKGAPRESESRFSKGVCKPITFCPDKDPKVHCGSFKENYIQID